MARRFMSFTESYSHHFLSQGMNSVGHARTYLGGLMGKGRRKNIETVCGDMGADYQGLEQFVSSSPWDERALLDDLSRGADAEIGGGADSALYIDETSFLKKGHASVGVARQYSGRAGKVENCQVGVFACLGNGPEVCPVDFRLYLPEAWAGDAARCAKARVPEAERVCRPKWALALDMVRGARGNGVRFSWVGADSLYGNNTKFTRALEDEGETFVGDVHVSTKVWASKPSLEGAAPRAGRGRPRTRTKLSAKNRARYLTVEELCGERFGRESREVTVRKTAKGRLRARFWAREVWSWEPGWPGARRRVLLVREDADGGFKYTLTNMPADTPWERLAYMQGQRYWIEHAFGECKSQLGMAQYQVRVWRGWHHHMALVCLAALFALKEKRRAGAAVPLLSTRDITELMDLYLPRAPRTEEEVYRQMKERHRQRQQDIDRKAKKTARFTSRKRKPTRQTLTK